MKRSTLTLTSAGLLMLVASVLKPDLGIEAAERYDRVAAHPGLEQLSAVFFLLCGVAFVLAGIVAYAGRPSGRGSSTIAVGAVLTALAGLWQAAGISAFGMWFALVFQEHTPRSAVLPLLDGNGPGQHLFDVLLLCELLGPAVVAVGLHRAGRAHWSLTVVWLVGIVGYGATEFVSRPGQAASLLVATAALFLIGRGLDTRRTPADAEPVGVPA